MSLVSQVRNKMGRAKGYSGCFRCGGTWDYAQYHSTDYTGNGGGCFPLCEPCWSGLTPEERLPYYALLVGLWLDREQMTFDGWEKYAVESIEKWPAIRDAVLRGL